MARYEEWLTSDGLALLTGWAREGKSEEEIAELAGVSVRTLRSWKSKSPMIQLALATDGAVADFQVEDALLRKALGYESVEKKVEVNPKGERKEVETTKQVGPDMSAISFWLKKRRPERWGDYTENGPKPENNLLEKAEEGGLDLSEIPELQSPAEAGADLVEVE